MPRQRSKTGDVFWVPLEDGSFCLGQIVEIQRDALNSITCAFYDYRRPEPTEEAPEDFDLLSVQFVTPDLFTSGTWPRVANLGVSLEPNQLPYRETEKLGWVGATVVGSRIISKFLSAFYGLRDWHEMHDPSYYQKLLIPGRASYAAT